MASYTVFDHGATRQGDARIILEQFRQQAAANAPEFGSMSVEQYADALIEDAPYFVERELFRALETQVFETKYDRALTYLAQMPSSGIRILTVRAA
ncbi:MAG: hypothetical protein WBD40_19400 [Tepidisphaeraceae bacterium]